MAAQWYLEYDDGRKYGPVTIEEERKYAVAYEKPRQIVVMVCHDSKC